MWYNQKTKKKDKKKKLNDVSIRLPHELNQQFFYLLNLMLWQSQLKPISQEN